MKSLENTHVTYIPETPADEWVEGTNLFPHECDPQKMPYNKEVDFNAIYDKRYFNAFCEAQEGGLAKDKINSVKDRWFCGSVDYFISTEDLKYPEKFFPKDVYGMFTVLAQQYMSLFKLFKKDEKTIADIKKMVSWLAALMLSAQRITKKLNTIEKPIYDDEDPIDTYFQGVEEYRRIQNAGNSKEQELIERNKKLKVSLEQEIKDAETYLKLKRMELEVIE